MPQTNLRQRDSKRKRPKKLQDLLIWSLYIVDSEGRIGEMELDVRSIHTSDIRGAMGRVEELDFTILSGIVNTYRMQSCCVEREGDGTNVKYAYKYNSGRGRRIRVGRVLECLPWRWQPSIQGKGPREPLKLLPHF